MWRKASNGKRVLITKKILVQLINSEGTREPNISAFVENASVRQSKNPFLKLTESDINNKLSKVDDSDFYQKQPRYGQKNYTDKLLNNTSKEDQEELINYPPFKENRIRTYTKARKLGMTHEQAVMLSAEMWEIYRKVQR